MTHSKSSRSATQDSHSQVPEPTKIVTLSRHPDHTSRSLCLDKVSHTPRVTAVYLPMTRNQLQRSDNPFVSTVDTSLSALPILQNLPALYKITSPSTKVRQLQDARTEQISRNLRACQRLMLYIQRNTPLRILRLHSDGLVLPFHR